MKYKVGDKVKLVENEKIRQDIKELMITKNWIATITSVEENGKVWPIRYYLIKEAPCKWETKHIEDYADPIFTRWEILDL